MGNTLLGSVLILILMELPHWDLARFFEIRGLGDVLILILMELPHWDDEINKGTGCTDWS